MGKTTIAWTQETWNPTRGCSFASDECHNCYAMKQAHRFSGPGKPYAGLTKLTKIGPVWTGEVRAVPEMLDIPLRKQKPTMFFVDSMSDLFHASVADDLVAAVFGVMAFCQRHTFQLLTKRPERMLRFFRFFHGGDYESNLMWWFNAACNALPDNVKFGIRNRPLPPTLPLPNVWLGVSAGRQKTFDERVEILAQVPAALHFVSLEPQLEAIDMRTFLYRTDNVVHDEPSDGDIVEPRNALDWVIVGGESGSRARPFDIEWARDAIRATRATKTACFIKQLGTDHAALYERVRKDHAGADPSEWPADLRVREFPLHETP